MGRYGSANLKRNRKIYEVSTGHYDRWHCTNCDAHVNVRLKGPNPFEPKIAVVGCPRCHSINTMIAGCNREGCTQKATEMLEYDAGEFHWRCDEHLLESEGG